MSTHNTHPKNSPLDWEWRDDDDENDDHNQQDKGHHEGREFQRQLGKLSQYNIADMHDDGILSVDRGGEGGK
ncbi:hypothetical protein HK102_009692, partial [Quaeritorhiza haematococci]